MVPTVTFTATVEGLDEVMLSDGFFDGWAAPPTKENHLALLRGSTHVALALDDKRVIGFASAVSDGILSAYIPLLEVLPPYRRQGIGSKLVVMLLEQVAHLYMVDVMCDDDVLPFYEELGFQRAGGAVRRNYAWNAI